MKRVLIILLCLSPLLSYAQGNCLDFDGYNDRLRIESSITGSSDFTLEYWMYTHDHNAENDLYVTWGEYGRRFEIRTDHRGKLAIYEGRWHITDTYVAKNTWYHVSVTRSNNNCKLYLNGQLKLSFTPQFLLNTFMNMFYWYTAAPQYHVKGKLDELRLWDIARSQNDINESMNCEMVGDEPNLVGYWNFNQEIPSGNNAGKTVAHDISFNSNNGTLNNFSLNGGTSNWILSDADIPNSCACIDEDVTPPTAMCQDITVSLDANGQAVITADMINNGSDDECTDVGDLTLSLSRTSFDCDDQFGGGDLFGDDEDDHDPLIVDPGYPQTTLTVTDEAGNSSTCTATVTVEDNLAPIIADNPTDIILCGAQTVSWIKPTATDNCSSVSVSSSHSPGDYFNLGTTQVTYDFTDGSGNTSSCSFNITIGDFPDIAITQSLLPEFCQGISLLEATLVNENDLATPFSYVWSDGLGNDAQATAFSNGTYTVTVTDNYGCESEDSTIVDEEESDIFSSYVLLANLEIKTKRTTMTGGGIGVYGVNKKARILKSSLVNTFVKAPIVQVKSGSTVGSTIEGEADVALPDFVFNTTNCSNNIVVQAGETLTLTDNTYGKITIKEDGVLIVNSPEWYVNEIDMKQYSELKFDQATNVMVKTRMRLGKNIILNIDGEAVTFYVEENFEVKEGTDFSGHVYAKQKIHAKKAKNSNQTYMKGTFLSEDVIQSDDFVNWDWAEFCNEESAIGEPVGCGDPAPFAAIINEFDQINGGLRSRSKGKIKGFSIAPNPSLGVFNINMSSYIGQEVDINIYNNLGKMVYRLNEKQLSNPIINMDLSNNMDVMYHIKITIDGKEKISRKLVIIRP